METAWHWKFLQISPFLQSELDLEGDRGEQEGFSFYTAELDWAAFDAIFIELVDSPNPEIRDRRVLFDIYFLLRTNWEWIEQKLVYADGVSEVVKWLHDRLVKLTKKEHRINSKYGLPTIGFELEVPGSQMETIFGLKQDGLPWKAFLMEKGVQRLADTGVVDLRVTKDMGDTKEIITRPDVIP